MSIQHSVSGSEALAYGALQAGVYFVTGYPGSPATATVEALIRLSGPDVVVEWAINEKSAMDAAIGVSLAGARALVCVKSVGLNVALDSLMVANLAPGDGGLVILTGDDPGGWGSQNEQDSRPLVAAAEVPMLEPTRVTDAAAVMHAAFELSEEAKVPVVVRITRALASSRAVVPPPAPSIPVNRAAGFHRQRDRWTVLPIQVVDLHEKLRAALAHAGGQFERWTLDQEEGEGRLGIVASGYVYEKLRKVLLRGDPPAVRILRLASLNPLPAERIAGFLQQIEAVLVLEELFPHVEVQIQAIAQRIGWVRPVYGRLSGHVPWAGELLSSHLVQSLVRFLPGWEAPRVPESNRVMPSRQTLCEGCPYIPTFNGLVSVMDQHGGRDAFVITGETGCLVRSQLPPWELLDAKYAMGSSIGVGAGLARAGVPQKVVVLSGDSAFLHSGLGELIDAAQAGLSLLVTILDNGTTALSGKQPHPGTAYDARGRARRPVDLAALVRAAGVNWVRVVAPPDAKRAFEEAMTAGRLAVVIVRGPCPPSGDKTE